MNDYIDTDTARQAVTMLLNQFGIDVKPEDMKSKVEEEKESMPIYEAMKKLAEKMRGGSKSKIPKKS